MRFIVLDTADARGSVAVFQDEEELIAEAHAGEEDYSSWLLRAVKRVLSATSLSLSQFDGYAVCAGPGSFTGLRVGLTTVKAWAEIYGGPIAAVSRLEALSYSQRGAEEQFRAVCVDARRSQVFAGLYERREGDFVLRGEESVMALPDFVANVAEQTGSAAVRWISPDAELLAALPKWPQLAAQGHSLQHVAAPFSLHLGRLAFRDFRLGRTRDGLSLEANYVRRSDAELLWKGK